MTTDTIDAHTEVGEDGLAWTVRHLPTYDREGGSWSERCRVAKIQGHAPDSTRHTFRLSIWIGISGEKRWPPTG